MVVLILSMVFLILYDGVELIFCNRFVVMMLGVCDVGFCFGVVHCLI